MLREIERASDDARPLAFWASWAVARDAPSRKYFEKLRMLEDRLFSDVELLEDRSEYLVNVPAALDNGVSHRSFLVRTAAFSAAAILLTVLVFFSNAPFGENNGTEPHEIASHTSPVPVLVHENENLQIAESESDFWSDSIFPLIVPARDSLDSIRESFSYEQIFADTVYRLNVSELDVLSKSSNRFVQRVTEDENFSHLTILEDISAIVMN